jgi:hypothetical protein
MLGAGDGPLRPSTNQVRGFLDYLHGRYLEWHQDDVKRQKKEGKLEPDEKPAPTLDGFLAFSQEFLTKNPPANPIYLGVGIGVRLANGDVVGLSQPQAEKPMRDEGVPITLPQSIPGMRDISDTSGIPVMRGR